MSITKTISYAPLWKTLIDKGLKKTDLISMANIGSGTLAKLSKNRIVHDQYFGFSVILSHQFNRKYHEKICSNFGWLRSERRQRNQRSHCIVALH